MRRIRERSKTSLLLVGIVLAEAGVVLVGFSEWSALNLSMRELCYAGGFSVCAGGMFLIWKEPFTAAICGDRSALGRTTVNCKETFLGSINLNGYYFEAFEEEAGPGGRRFRLRSAPPIGPEREAGFIRYLIYEGFIETRWPRLSGKIEEEADWAFLL